MIVDAMISWILVILTIVVVSAYFSASALLRRSTRKLSPEEYTWDRRSVPGWPNMKALQDSPEFRTLQELDDWWEKHNPNPERRIAELEEKLAEYKTMIKKYAAGSMFQGAGHEDFDTVSTWKAKAQMYGQAYHRAINDLYRVHEEFAEYKAMHQRAKYGGMTEW